MIVPFFFPTTLPQRLKRSWEGGREDHFTWGQSGGQKTGVHEHWEQQQGTNLAEQTREQEGQGNGKKEQNNKSKEANGNRARAESGRGRK